MMEYEESYNDGEVRELVDDFKEMVDEGTNHFFDSDDLAIIASELIAGFDFQYADAAIEHGNSLYPDDISFKILRVRRLMMGLQIDEAGQELRKLEEAYPPSAALYMEKAFYIKISGSDEDAYPYIKKAYDMTPDDPWINFELGSELIRMADYDRGLELVAFALEHDETLDEQLFTLSYIFEDDRPEKDAVVFFTRLTDMFPLNKSAWFALGLAFSWSQEYQQSIEAYLNVISLDDSASTAYFNIGNAYYELQDFPQAMHYYHETYRIDDHDFHALTGIGDCLYQMNRNEEALQYYYKTLDIIPDDPDALMGVVACLKECGRNDEAEVFIEQVFARNPQGFDMMFGVMPFFHEEVQLEKLKHFFNMTFSKITAKEEFMTLFTVYCTTKPEYYALGIEVLEEYLDNEEVASVVSYHLAALHYLSGNHHFAENYLKTALLINYEGHKMFLSLHPDLSSYTDIQRLIMLYHPKDNSF